MKYIIDMKDFLSSSEERILLSAPVKILFASKLIPLLCIEAPAEAAPLIRGFPFVEGCRNERAGTVQEIVRYSSRQNALHIIPNPRHKMLHDAGMFGEGIHVYVLDTYDGYFGSDGQFEDFLRNVKGRQDGSHGEKVCSIIKEIAPKCELHVGRVGNGRTVSESAAIPALEWAILAEADVINISWGFQKRECSRVAPCTICRYCDLAHQRHINIVAAAGNEWNGNQIITLCPAKNKTVITVGSVNLSGNGKAEHSCVGVLESEKPDILSSGNITYRGESDQGTSFAAPCVSGFIADVAGIGLPKEEAKCIVLSSTRDLQLSPHEQGRGLVDAQKILDSIGR